MHYLMNLADYSLREGERDRETERKREKERGGCWTWRVNGWKCKHCSVIEANKIGS